MGLVTLVGGQTFAADDDIAGELPFGGSCSLGGHCPTSRRSVALPAELAAAVADAADELLAAASLVLGRRYTNGTAFRIGVRRADWPAGDSWSPLTASMPSMLTVAAHRRAVAADLARIVAAPPAPDARPPAVACVVGGPATDRYGADLVISHEVMAGGTALHLDHHAHVHDAAFADRLLGHLVNLLGQMTAAADRSIGDLQLLGDAERAQLRRFTDTRRDYPRDASIYQLFAAQVTSRPDQMAVCHRDGSLTYRELDEQALRLARVLHERGVRRHSRVALLLKMSPRLLVAVLAVLRLGAAYVPVDAGFPARRRDFVLRDSGADLLLVEDGTPSTQVPTLDLTQPDLAPRPDDRLPPFHAEAGDPAYVMYTSGSTGRPKGVLVNQRAVVRLVRNTDYTPLSSDTRILQTGAVAFDATTFEFWGALLNGGTLVLVPGTTVLSTTELDEAIRRHRVNTLFLTSSLFHQIVEQDAAVLDRCTVLVGGDRLSPEHVATAMGSTTKSVFVHVYGPTENTTFSTAHRITRRYTERIPIGRPIPNSTAYVLDRDGHPQPVGVPGEIHLGGDGLSDGYLNRPELNDSAFVIGGIDNPERLYRSGDIGYWTADGLLEFVGRHDSQVKIRGFRVELAEVEGALSRLPSVREAVVLLRRGADGPASLCAYFTAATVLDAAELRTALRQDLPDHMVPSSFRQVDTMPLTRNHKVDRAALAMLEPADPADRAARRAPRTPLEATVARIFAEVLDLPSVSVDDSFFALGGHSLLAMRLWGRLRSELAVEFELRQIMDTPTAAGLAASLERDRPAAVARPRLVRRP